MHTIEIVALFLEEPVNQSVKVWLQQSFVTINFSACITSKPNIFLSGTSHLHMMNDSVIYTNRDGIPHMLEMPDASIHFAGSVVCGRVGRALPYSSPIHVASLLAAVWIGLKLFSAAEQTLYSFKLAHTNCCKWVVTAKSSKPGRAMAKKSLQNDGFILIANWMYD